MATVLRVKVTDSAAYLSSGGRVQPRSFCSDLRKQLQSRCALHNVIMLSTAWFSEGQNSELLLDRGIPGKKNKKDVWWSQRAVLILAHLFDWVIGQLSFFPSAFSSCFLKSGLFLVSCRCTKASTKFSMCNTSTQTPPRVCAAWSSTSTSTSTWSPVRTLLG